MLNGQTLAYIGDAYYELLVRKHFVGLGYTNVGILHKFSSKCTSSVSQAEAIHYLINNSILTEQEILYYKRGRNANIKTKRKVDLATYQQATGFESLIGYLAINDEDRCLKIVNIVIKFLMEKEVNLDGKNS